MVLYLVLSSRIGDVEDLPDVRVEASSPGPRVTFNIQDTVPSARLSVCAVSLDTAPGHTLHVHFTQQSNCDITVSLC